MARGKFVAYYRVSTDKQGRSGLGLKAQRKAVADYLGNNGWELIAEFQEVESGKRNGRPELEKALATCKTEKAVLVVAKMDRVGRRASYVLNLLDNSGVTFKFVEMPHASDLEIGVRAVVAQEEGRLISERTKAALAEKKRQLAKEGKRLGNPRPEASLKRAVASRKAKANLHAQNILPIIREVQESGVTSLAGVARALDARGIKTAMGAGWHANTVRRVLQRAAAGKRG